MASLFSKGRNEEPCICLLCNDHTTDYCKLTCRHSYCNPCLETLSQNFTKSLPEGIKCTACESLALTNGCISTILDVVESEFENCSELRRNDGSVICNSCVDGKMCVALCRDCNELMCSGCLKAHRRVILTKDHFIVALNANLNPNICDKHKSEYRIFCETCKESLCSDCMCSEHAGHTIGYYKDAVSSCKKFALKVLEDAKVGIEAMRESIQEAENMSNRVELSVQRVSSEIRSTFQRHKSALDERENELLHQLDKVRQVKNSALMFQLGNLRMATTKMSHIVEYIQKVLDSGYDNDLLKAKDKMKEQLNEICLYRSNLQPNEDDQIKFTQPDSALLSAISTLGFLSTSGFGPNSVAVGDGLMRALRGRQSAFFVNVKDHLGESQVVGGDSVYARIQSPTGHNCKIRVIDQQNGSYFIYYTPDKEGQHIISVMLRGMHISNSPFTLNVRTGRNYKLLGSVLFSFGKEGEGDGRLCRPWGVCTDKDGNFIVADRSNNRIQVFDCGGNFKYRFGEYGSRPGQFDRPAGVACDNLGRIIVTDKDNHRVQIFTADGKFILKFGEKGGRDGQFNYPWGVAVNARGEILIADTRNHRVQLFTCNGEYLKKYGFEGGNWKQFDSPRGVAFNAEGHVIATDFNNHRIVVIHPNFKIARFLGIEGNRPGQFQRPQGVVIDPEGHIIVADSKNNRIQIFQPDGHFLFMFGSGGKGRDEMDRPCGICLSPEGYILVVDFGNNRVQVY